jgi:hypothetical protein
VCCVRRRVLQDNEWQLGVHGVSREHKQQSGEQLARCL